MKKKKNTQNSIFNNELLSELIQGNIKVHAIPNASNFPAYSSIHSATMQLYQCSNSPARAHLVPTSNYYLLTFKLTPTQNALLLFIATHADTCGYLFLSTAFIRLFSKMNRNLFKAKKLNSKNKTKKNLRFSQNYVFEDLIYLIENQCVIRVHPRTSHFIVNPLYFIAHERHAMMSVSNSIAVELNDMCSAGASIHDLMMKGQEYLMSRICGRAFNFKYKEVLNVKLKHIILPKWGERRVRELIILTKERQSRLGV